MSYYLLIDVETGGLDPTAHALLSVGAIIATTKEHDLTLVSSFYVPIQPTRDVTLDALQVNKIKIDDHVANAIPSVKAYQRFITWLRTYVPSTERPILVGWNVRFDIGFLEQWLADHNDHLRNYASYRAIDVQSIMSFFIETGCIPETARGGLAGAAKYFKIDTVHHHHALVDVAMTFAVWHGLWRMVRTWMQEEKTC